ncbi:hypothetical protein MP228_003539 [Amoeboaphelidium protococcarum]|nr:hypothetical protein MP228_003539 [Amoeboaphelidium protococcarum]
MSIIEPQYPQDGLQESEQSLRFSSAGEDDRFTDADENYEYPLNDLAQAAHQEDEFQPLSPANEVGPPIADDLDDEDYSDDKSRVKYRKRFSNSAPEGLSYTLLKYPLLIIVLSIMMFELVLYILVRQYVNLHEYLFAWRGTKKSLRDQMHNAENYEQWQLVAREMDKYLQSDLWKSVPESAFYDHRLIKRITRLLMTYRQKVDPLKRNNVNNVVQQLQVQDDGGQAIRQLQRVLLDGGVKSNLGGIENSALYSRSYMGTKYCIDEHVEEVVQSLNTVKDSSQLSIEQKQRFFKKCDKSYGRTALCLSGGACLGYYHLGVIKVLLENKILPKCIAGTSAGSLIASFTCVRTDQELMEELTPDLYRFFTACDQTMSSMMKRLRRDGSAFDPLVWIEKIQYITKGDTTFLEAYEMTGRILNISVIPIEEHSPAKLLNYKTSPDIVIWSAVLCSSAVPGILPPMQLKRKLPDGTIVTYDEEGAFWRDGSIRIDVPIIALHQMFHVNYTIVSQVNPHIVLFFFDHRGSSGRPTAHRSGKGWRGGFLASYMEHTIKLDLVKWLRTIRDLSLLPDGFKSVRALTSVFLQKFDGSLTILPRATWSDYLHILTDPSKERMERFFDRGQRNTWPKLSMIKNRMSIEVAIQEARRSVESK